MSGKISVEASKWIIRGTSVVIAIIAWQLIGGYLFSNALSTPTQVVNSFVYLSLHTTFLSDLRITLEDFLLGFAIAAVMGVVGGLAMARWQTVETAIDPYVNALYSTPYVALAPLFVIWLGVGFYTLLAVVILSSVFVILLNTYAGMKNINRDLVDTGRAFGFSRLALYRKVMIPGSLPYIMTGLRLGIGRAFVGVIVAELLVRLLYLGFLIEYYAELLELAPEITIAVTIGLIGLFMTEGLKRVEARISTWKVETTGG